MFDIFRISEFLRCGWQVSSTKIAKKYYYFLSELKIGDLFTIADLDLRMTVARLILQSNQPIWHQWCVRCETRTRKGKSVILAVT